MACEKVYLKEQVQTNFSLDPSRFKLVKKKRGVKLIISFSFHYIFLSGKKKRMPCNAKWLMDLWKKLPFNMCGKLDKFFVTLSQFYG